MDNNINSQTNNIPQENQNSSTPPISETKPVQGQSQTWKIATFILLLIVIVVCVFSYYLYSQLTTVKNELKQSLEEIDNMKLVDTPSITLTPTPTPADYYFNDSSLKTNYYPVMYNTYSLQQQKVAQTFTLSTDLTTQVLILKASFGSGDDIFVNIYQTGNVEEFTKGTLVAKGKFSAKDIIKQDTFEVVFDTPIQLSANVGYVLVVSVDDKSTQTAIAFTENDFFNNGKMYEYNRLVGGNGEVTDNNHSWQPQNSQDLLYYFKSL